MAAPRRRQREIGHIRDDILQAAARAFERSGRARTTMQDIAREAGYTAASLYTYFRSKEEIFLALMEMLTNEYVRTFDEVLPPGLSFRQKFELLICRQLELVERRRPLVASFLLMADAMPLPDEGSLGICFRDYFEKRITCLREWIRENAQPDDIGGLEPDTAARFLVGFILALIPRWVDSPTPSLVERVSLISNLFFHGVSGPPSSSRK